MYTHVILSFLKQTVSLSGALPLRIFGGAVQVSQLVSRASPASLQTSLSVPLLSAVAWQQTRHSSFFNKCKSVK